MDQRIFTFIKRYTFKNSKAQKIKEIYIENLIISGLQILKFIELS